MPRFLFALAVVALAVAPDRAGAFGGHFFCYPLFGRVFGPPVVFAPVYPIPVYEFVPFAAYPAPAPCCPAVPLAAAPPGAPLPRVQRVPAAVLNEPAPPARDINPAGVAVPRAADPTPREGEGMSRSKPAESLLAPRPADKTSDGQTIPKANVPTAPKTTPAPGVPKDPDDSPFPPLKLTPPMEEAAFRTQSRSSPLAGERRVPRVDVVPVEGTTPAAGPTRTAGFFNRTDRAVALTVQGETVTLPGQHSVTARVPAGFTWKLDGGPERTTDVPAGSPGVEVVIRK